MTPKAQAKKKTNWTYSKLRTIVLQRRTSRKEKVNPKKWEENSASHISVKGLLPRIHLKNTKNLNIKIIIMTQF